MILLLSLLACGGAAPDGPVASTLQGRAFGTSWTVRWLPSEGGPDLEQAEALIVEELAQVDALMSTWREDSELSRARITEGPLAVSPQTAGVVRSALELAERSGGAFDPTVQPLVELWGIHGKRRTTAPTDEEVAAAMLQVGWKRVVLGGTAEVPTLDTAGTALDLSAIAKGHAVDEVSEALQRAGADRHMVEVGGEVRVAGLGPNNEGWRLGVDDPIAAAAPGTKLIAVLSLTDAALATSGNYRNRYVVDDQTVVHTLDPRVGRPVQSDVVSASVVAPTCEQADGVATALMVLGAEGGMALVEALAGVETLLVLGDGEQRRSTGLSAHLVDGKGSP